MVSYKIKGVDVVQKRFKRMLSEMQSSPDAMTKIAYLGIRDINDHFVQSQGPKNKWLDLKHRSGKPLMDTGLLRGSTRFKANRLDVLLFNNIKYGKHHQYGAPKRFIPQRKWMWISDLARRKMAVVYRKKIMGAF